MKHCIKQGLSLLCLMLTVQPAEPVLASMRPAAPTVTLLRIGALTE